MLGKAVLCVQSFGPTQLNRKVLGAWNTLLPKDKEPPQPVLGLSTCPELSFPVSDSIYTPLFCLYMCVSLNTWATPLFCLSSVDHSEVQEGSMQANGPLLASRSDCWQWGLTPPPKADLFLSLLHVRKALFHSVVDYSMLSLMTPIPRLSGQKCALLVLLVVSNRCRLLNNLQQFQRIVINVYNNSRDI